MRALRLAVAFAAALASPQLAPPAGAAPSSSFSVSCGSANAGRDVTCTVTRTSGGKGIYVLFATTDATAHAGIDYTAVHELLYFRAADITQTVAIHTAVNPTATGTLTFTASIAASTALASATVSIVEPAPVPTPAPAPQWVSAPMSDNGFVRCKAVGGCHGLTGYPDIVAQPGDVLVYAWNGVDINGRMIGVFWPQGHDPHLTANKGDYLLGVEGYVDEWEGVAPAP